MSHEEVGGDVFVEGMIAFLISRCKALYTDFQVASVYTILSCSLI